MPKYKIIYDKNNNEYTLLNTNDYTPEYLKAVFNDMYKEIGKMYPFFMIERLTYFAIFHFYTSGNEIFKAKCTYSELFEYRDKIQEFLHFHIW